MGSDDQELLALYAVEAAEHLGTLNEVLLRLETLQGEGKKAERRRFIEDLGRAAHSLKGASRAVGMASVEKIAHRMESIFDGVQSGKLELTPEVADALYDALDAIQILLDASGEPGFDLDALLAMLGNLAMPQAASEPSSATVSVPGQPDVKPEAQSQPQPDVQPDVRPEIRPELRSESRPQRLADSPRSGASLTIVEPAGPTPVRAVEETIRVAVAKLDDLMADASDLLIARSSIEQRLSDVKAQRRAHQRWQKEWRKVRTLYIRIMRQTSQSDNKQWAGLLEFLNLTQRHMRLSGQQLLTLDRALSADSLRLNLIADSLQARIRRVRLVPFETQISIFQRTVRDVARQVGKEVGLQISGAGIELDKRVLESIKDPVMHLLRNAVDHGIETPEERTKSGKLREGMIILAVSQRGGNVMILIADDGRGIDVAAVRQAARRILGDAEVDALTDTEAVSLVMLPGLSTSTQITTISGRGIGLDVVRQNVEALQGRIDIESTYGAGTTFRLVIPVSLSTLRCMLARLGDETYAIPTSAIEQIISIDSIDPSARFSVGGRPMITIQGRSVGLISLADVLERPSSGDPHYAVVLATGDRRMAFLVDDLITEQDMVVKNLNLELSHVRHVAGATLLGSGEVLIILNVSDVLKTAQAQISVRPASARIGPSLAEQAKSVKPSAKTVLIVDDSITTRTLEKNILEAAGFEVITATDGLEALDALDREVCELVVADIEMPHLDGFELTSRIRRSDRFSHLPVILVTSLDAAEHKERGFQVGADAYIVKGNFDQGELLQTVRQLIGYGRG